METFFNPETTPEVDELIEHLSTFYQLITLADQ